MGVETVSLVIAAFLNASLGIAALLRNIRSRLGVAFATWVGCLFLHDAVAALEKFQGSPWLTSTAAHALGVLLAGPAMLWFLQQMVATHRQALRKCLWAYVPVGALFLGALVLPGFERLSPLVLVLAHMAYLFPAGVWVLVLRRASRSSTLSRERMRLGYAFWGGVATLTFFITDILYIGGLGVPPLGTLARTLYLFFIFHTFVQRELMTAEEVVAKVALFSGIAGMLSTIFLFLVSWVGDKRDLLFFNTLIASLVIVVLFEPIRTFSLWATRKLLLRRSRMLEDELTGLSQRLRGVVEPPELCRRVAATLARVVGAEACSVFLLERDGLSFVRFDSLGVPLLQDEEGSSAPLVEYMTLRRGRPFVLETVENDRDSFHSPQARKFCEDCLESMRKLGADFVLPFVHEGKVMGFALGRSSEMLMLSNEQLRLFMPVLRQVGFQLRNSQTLGTLSERSKLAAVGEMAAGLAHEIKNPLGAIKGAAELLASQPQTDAAGAEFLKIILDETDRLSGVLTDFLDYAKPRRPSAAGNSCDPLVVAQHAAALVLQDAKVKVELEGPAEPLWAEGDPDALKQVLLNLLLNAVEAVKGEEHPRIVVRVRSIRPRRLVPFADRLPLFKVWEGWQRLETGERRGWVEIEVADTGMGIPFEEREKIFTPFYTTKPRGTGLGLAICQRMVEAMGGSISVRGNRPKGTVFTLHLPARDEGDGGAPPPKGRTRELSV